MLHAYIQNKFLSLVEIAYSVIFNAFGEVCCKQQHLNLHIIERIMDKYRSRWKQCIERSRTNSVLRLTSRHFVSAGL